MAEYNVTGVQGDRIDTDRGPFSMSVLEGSTEPAAQDIVRQAKAREAEFLGTQTATPALGSPEKPGVADVARASLQSLAAPTGPAGPPGPPVVGVPASAPTVPLVAPPAPAAPAAPARPQAGPVPSQAPQYAAPVAPRRAGFPAGRMLAPFAANVAATTKEWEQSLEDRAEIQRKATDLAVVDAWGKEDMARELSNVEQQAFADRQEIEKRKQAAVAEKMQKLDAAEEQFSQMRVEDFWAKQDTAPKIIAAIAMSLGAFRQAIKGGPNIAADMIDKMVKADLAKQRANINLARVPLEHMRGALARTAGMYDTELEQNQAALLASYQSAKRTAQAMASKRAGDEGLLQIQDITAALDEKMNAIRASLAQSAYAMAQKQVVAGARAAAKRAPTSGFVDYDEKRFVKRAGGVARDASDAKKIDDAYDAVDGLRPLIRRLETMKTKHSGGWSTMSLADRGRANSLTQAISLKLAVMFNLGAISAEDKLFVEGVSGGNPLDMWNMQTANTQELGRMLTDSELILQRRTNPVSPEQIPELFRGQVKHSVRQAYAPGAATQAAHEGFTPGVTKD